MRDYQNYTETQKNKSANALSLNGDYQKCVNNFRNGLSIISLGIGARVAGVGNWADFRVRVVVAGS